MLLQVLVSMLRCFLPRRLHLQLVRRNLDPLLRNVLLGAQLATCCTTPEPHKSFLLPSDQAFSRYYAEGSPTTLCITQRLASLTLCSVMSADTCSSALVRCS